MNKKHLASDDIRSTVADVVHGGARSNPRTLAMGMLRRRQQVRRQNLSILEKLEQALIEVQYSDTLHSDDQYKLEDSIGRALEILTDAQ